ncbi:MAG: SAM-dependent methyltransferase [Synechococcaceae cyanobacterium SM2_3_60]|nr:SAM-dependent methyltransferase [Synechococcaceae cyanobacterium SM2_3_60]
MGLREQPLLQQLRQETAQHPQAHLQSPPEQVQLLAFLIRLIGATQVLEIGVFQGYSSLAMALALPTTGRLVACDLQPVPVAERYWQAAGVRDRIEFRQGPALETLRDISPQTFDLAYIDADKRAMPTYYERCLRWVRPGGVIAIDNTLWSGRVLDPDSQDPRTQAIQSLNQTIHTDPRVDMLLLPLADGLTLVRVLG